MDQPAANLKASNVEVWSSASLVPTLWVVFHLIQLKKTYQLVTSTSKTKRCSSTAFWKEITDCMGSKTAQKYDLAVWIGSIVGILFGGIRQGFTVSHGSFLFYRLWYIWRASAVAITAIPIFFFIEFLINNHIWQVPFQRLIQSLSIFNGLFLHRGVFDFTYCTSRCSFSRPTVASSWITFSNQMVLFYTSHITVYLINLTYQLDWTPQALVNL